MVLVKITVGAIAVVYSATLAFLKVNNDLGKGSNLGFVCLAIGYIIGLAFSTIYKDTITLFYFYSWFLPLFFLLMTIPFWYYYTDPTKEKSTNTHLSLIHI